jgi:hypothetical protein
MRAMTLALWCGGLLGWTAAGWAQPGVSVRDLVAENERLTQELRQARAVIAGLETEVIELRNDRRGVEVRLSQAEAMLSSLRREMSSPAEAAGPSGVTMPADPLASPATLLRELRDRYFELVRSEPQETEAQRQALRERVVLWCRAMHRQLRDRRTWLVSFDEIMPLSGGVVARMTVLDGATGQALGEPVDVAVPRKFADRVGPRGRWWLTSVVIAKPTFNESRQTRGVFEFPAFIGPFVEFDFELDWIALRAWDPRDPAGGGPVQGDEPGGQPAGEQEAQVGTVE